MHKIVLFIIATSIFVSCQTKDTERAFYYWKTRFAPTPKEELMLSSLKVNKLYIRFFDVDWDESKGEPTPRGKINFVSKVKTGVTVVPVVFITNKTFVKLNTNRIEMFAHKVLKQINFVASSNNIAYSELQFDCDWTETTRASYFNFINHIRRLTEEQKNTISATIRLHQVKYYKITGIPPVDRGMLMFYNMGKIDTIINHNSIYNTKDAAKYIAFCKVYPLPLDLVLPAFSWGIHIRNGKVINLLSALTMEDFKNNANFIPVCENQFKVKQSFFYKGFYLMQDDLVKVEQTTPELCKQAAMQVVNKMNSPATVAFYHLDSLNLTQYEPKDFEEIFDYFR